MNVSQLYAMHEAEGGAAQLNVRGAGEVFRVQVLGTKLNLAPAQLS